MKFWEKITRVLKNEGINKFKDSLGTEEEIINYGKIMGIQINENTTIDQICQNLSSLTLSSSKPAMNNNYSNVNLVQIAEYIEKKNSERVPLTDQETLQRAKSETVQPQLYKEAIRTETLHKITGISPAIFLSLVQEIQSNKAPKRGTKPKIYPEDGLLYLLYIISLI